MSIRREGHGMGVLRSTYEYLKAASVAHAQWDYEVSMSIVKNRKKMLVPQG
jgi:hypothetical protein